MRQQGVIDHLQRCPVLVRLTIGQHDADGLYPFGLQPCQQPLKVDRGHDIIGHHRNLLA